MEVKLLACPEECKRENERFFELLGRVAIRVEILRPIHACRDPKDDKFLSLAVNGRAHALVSGDGDLLALHRFMRIPILTPAAFLAEEAGFPE